jgi:hypothetical protein
MNEYQTIPFTHHKEIKSHQNAMKEYLKESIGEEIPYEE